MQASSMQLFLRTNIAFQAQQVLVEEGSSPQRAVRLVLHLGEQVGEEEAGAAALSCDCARGGQGGGGG